MKNKCENDVKCWNWIDYCNVKIVGRRVTFDTSWSALGNSVGDGGTGRIDHGHESGEAHSAQREVGVVSIEFESFYVQNKTVTFNSLVAVIVVIVIVIIVEGKVIGLKEQL